MDRPLKHSFFECAERIAIYKAARIGLAVEGLSMVTSSVPCSPCARAIIEAGISEVITSARAPYSPTRQQAETALTMFREAAVKVTLYEGQVGGPRLRSDGEYYSL